MCYISPTETYTKDTKEEERDQLVRMPILLSIQHAKFSSKSAHILTLS